MKSAERHEVLERSMDFSKKKNGTILRGSPSPPPERTRNACLAGVVVFGETTVKTLAAQK
jgi:hypothetical protein